VRDRFPGGVWFVPLADLNEARSLYMTIQQALALPHSRDIPPLEAIVAALSGRPSLLVLDNFEQLAASAADYVVTLLQRLPTLTLLITSRQALDLSGEQELGVLPLPVPRKVGTPERLLEFASVQMFVNRAQLRRQDFQITRRNAPMIVRLCEKLEGLPLAIELAAAWIRVLTPEQMVAQLERRLEFLVSRQSDLPERHRTLRAVMESSYRLLDPPLQAIFARLSVFRGGWTLEAAEFVCDVRALEALAQLQARSLIVAEEADIAHSETMRYRMLEAPAEYAAEQLPSEDRPFVAQRHTEYFLQLVEQARVPLAGPRPGVWLDRLESEMDNLRAALDRCQADPTGGATGLRFVRALFRYWIIRGRLIEGRERCIAALAHPGAQAADSLRASALFTVATLSYGLGDYAQARAFYEKSLTIREALQERAGIADILGNLGLILHEQGDLEAARPLYERTLALREEWNDDRGAARIRDCLSMILIAQGEFSKAREPLEASVALYTDLNDLV
jgi:predicted ATPase